MCANRIVRSVLAMPVLLAVLFALTVFAVAGEAGEKEVRDVMLRIADKDVAVRRAALDELARTRDARLAQFLEAYRQGSLHLFNGELVFCEQTVRDDQGAKQAPLFDPLTREPLLRSGVQIVVPARVIQDVSPKRRERKLVGDAILRLNLWSPDPEKRLAAVHRCGDFRRAEFLTLLDEVLTLESVDQVRQTTRESIWLIRLAGDVPDQSREARFSAARGLGEMRSFRALSIFEELLADIQKTAEKGETADAELTQTYQEAVERIENYQRFVRGFEYLFSGLSLGSVLILMALGLSIIFGLMGVINMAHGELMMIGAYATYETQQLFVEHLPQTAFNWYYVAALPAAFLSAALVGYLIEILVVRYLYGRPLETLLATWGVSLILIQAIRLRYGDNIAVNNPTWLRGGAEIMQDVIVPYNRCFIIVLCIFCVLLIHCLMRYTKTGLLVRATMQNREMADGLGVNTRRIDGYTFALGAGIAGIAGYALTLIGGVTPDMGQNYIVDSFLVVVTGGVGELAGVIWSGLGIGLLNKFLEPTSGAVWGKILILICVVFFIQWRPAGLFPPKGRLADV